MDRKSLRKGLAEVLDVGMEKVVPEADLSLDLGADSLGKVFILNFLEDTGRFHLSGWQSWRLLYKMKTVQDVIDIYDRYQKCKKVKRVKKKVIKPNPKDLPYVRERKPRKGSRGKKVHPSLKNILK